MSDWRKTASSLFQQREQSAIRETTNTILSQILTNHWDEGRQSLIESYAPRRCGGRSQVVSRVSLFA